MTELGEKLTSGIQVEEEFTRETPTQIKRKNKFRSKHKMDRDFITISCYSALEQQQAEEDESIRILRNVTLICTAFMIVEFTGGLMANSVAVISDALHLTIDIIGYFIQIIAALLAQKSIFKNS